MTLDKPLDEITEDDLQNLIPDVLEGQYLEYKREISKDTKGKSNFISTIASFANADGGDLVIGMAESNGYPDNLAGLSFAPDSYTRHLIQLARDNIRPLVCGIKIQHVPLSSGDYVIIVRVPRSWARPHMETFENKQRFHTRHLNGRAPMDVGEIRSAFLQSAEFGQRIAKWRTQTLKRIESMAAPKISAMSNQGYIALTFFPANSFEFGDNIDLKYLYNQSHDLVCFGGMHATRQRLTIDSLRGWIEHGREDPHAVQVIEIFRNGIVEFVDADSVRPRHIEKENIKFITINPLEKNIYNFVDEGLCWQKILGARPPIIVSLSLYNVSGYRFPIGSTGWMEFGEPIDRETLMIPEQIVENLEDSAAGIAKSLCDALRNAADEVESPNFDDDGNWIGQ